MRPETISAGRTTKVIIPTAATNANAHTMPVVISSYPALEVDVFHLGPLPPSNHVAIVVWQMA